jgi:hypothetical protein
VVEAHLVQQAVSNDLGQHLGQGDPPAFEGTETLEVRRDSRKQMVQVGRQTARLVEGTAGAGVFAAVTPEGRQEGRRCESNNGIEEQQSQGRC